MVSYLRKVALSVLGVSVLATCGFGYLAVRSVWIGTPAPAAVAPAEIAQPAPTPKPKRSALVKGADKKGQGND